MKRSLLLFLLVACDRGTPTDTPTDDTNVVGDDTDTIVDSDSADDSGTVDSDSGGATDTVVDTDTGGATDTVVDTDTGTAPTVVADFSLLDVNPTSPTAAQWISPRSQQGKVSAWYFGHST